MRWQIGKDDAGEAYIVDDPLAAVTASKLVGCRAADEMVAALLSIGAIFPPALAANSTFASRVARHLDSLLARGALATLAGLELPR